MTTVTFSVFTERSENRVSHHFPFLQKLVKRLMLVEKVKEVFAGEICAGGGCRQV
jgi:hypothetical protein